MMSRKFRQFILVRGMWEFRDWLLRLFRQPIFLFVTVWGHSVIFMGALAFKYLEAGTNPRPLTLLNAYYWAISTATTVGSSDLAPVTEGGKVVAIFMMIFGSLFLWSYTALFAASFVTPAVRKLERNMEVEVERVEREVLLDHATLKKLTAELEIFNKRMNRESSDIRYP